MGRPGRTPFKNRERDRRYAEIIKAAIAHPGGTRHVIPVRYPDEETAREHMRKIYSEARFQGYGRQVTPTVHEDGTVTLTFRLWNKAESRAYIAERERRGQRLAYRHKPKEK